MTTACHAGFFPHTCGVYEEQSGFEKQYSIAITLTDIAIAIWFAVLEEMIIARSLFSFSL